MTARNRKITAAALVGLSLSAAVTGCSSSAGGPSPSSAPGSPDASGSQSSGRFRYRDGEYSENGQYGNLPSSIGVSVTLADDRITAVHVTPHATNPTSRDLQERFAEAIPAVVVGKDIDEVHMTKVAGSSGTPVGFNAAIERIKAEASKR
ncbi:hypothetical protein [Streptomyces acidicola]|uniref:hypothetical protein n=1 Tax=Streptomyces acidicola TaxID=2596892 RepID=UPI0037FC7DA2